ncbi:MAG: site-specific integrase, partial [Syntrophorhabdaceae bacterium]|nr:site-specific integrase [Syntrophorhabdaceae bacterium]
MDLYHGLDIFISYMTAERGASPHTIDAYNRDIMQFLRYLESNAISMPTKKDIEGFIGLLRGQGKKARSILRVISALKGYFNFLVLEGHIKESPLEDIETPRFKAPIPEVLSQEEIVELIEATDDGGSSLRDRTMLELMSATGLRVSELIQLKKSDVNLEAGFLIALGKRSKERVVPIGSYSRDA